jgi:hypothetical protein
MRPQTDDEDEATEDDEDEAGEDDEDEVGEDDDNLCDLEPSVVRATFEREVRIDHCPSWTLRVY